MATIFDVPVMTRLPALLQDVSEGKILIPKFQRPFVWNDEQRLALMDSIQKQMPIGSLLVWRTTTHILETYDRLGPFTARDSGKEKGTRTYVLDGHQRLATLYAALNPPDETEELTQGQDNVFWPIYCDLDPPDQARERDLRFHVLPQSKRLPPTTWLPLNVLFDPIRLYDFQKTLMDAGRPELAREAERLANLFKDYALPVVPLVTDDLNEVTESFQRLSSQGTRMSEVHMLSALVFAKKLPLTQEFEGIAARLDDVGWSEIDHQVLLNILKVGWNLFIYSADTAFVRQKLEREPERLGALEGNLRRAIAFLADVCEVRGPAMLPSPHQIVALTEAARVRGERPFAPHTADALRRWFWATSYTHYFSGMTGNEFQHAIEHLRDIVLHDVDPCSPVLEKAEIEPLVKFDASQTRSRAFVLFLAKLAPRSPKDTDLEAFWLLAEQGHAAVTKIFADAPGWLPENRWIAPPRYLQSLRRLLPSIKDSIKWTHANKEAVLLSHGIDSQAYRALDAGDREAFFAARRAYLQSRERELLQHIDARLVMREEESPTVQHAPSGDKEVAMTPIPQMAIAQAFDEFLHGLEITEAERERADMQKVPVRQALESRLKLDDVFVAGSYSRRTAIRPLRDIDLFIVLNEQTHGNLRSASPQYSLGAIETALQSAYPSLVSIRPQRRSINIFFQGTEIGYDVVPAFQLAPSVYIIPDLDRQNWIKTNPTQHEELCKQADARAGHMLNRLIKAAKHWNAIHGRNLGSFHLEVMAYSAFQEPPSGMLASFQKLLAHLAAAIFTACPDPAGVGPRIDKGMPPAQRQQLAQQLRSAADKVQRAIELDRHGFPVAQAHNILRYLLGANYHLGR